MENLTAKIKEILDTPNEQIDIDYAATILLKVNRNRILNQSIVRRGNVAKLRYELQKIYDFRYKEDSLAEVKELEEKIVPVIKETFPVAEQKEASENKGLRADHDQLPDEIKAKYVENQNIFPRMRKLHEQLKLMGDAKACDRYPFLQELVDLDKQLRENWDVYDSFVIVPGETKETGENSEETEESANNIADNANNIAPDAKKISAARKYLSDNKTKLAELKELEDQSKYLELLSKMQERLTLLTDAKAGVSDEHLEELKALGLNG